MVPRDHVVEGTLRVGWFDDVAGEKHPFRLAGPDGKPIALCPNDGCGFLKYEVAMKIPAVRAEIEAWTAVREGRASDEQRRRVSAHDMQPSSMAAQALQHFPRDDAALQEAREHMQRTLNELSQRVNAGREGASAAPAPAPGEPGPGEPPLLSPDDVDKLTLYRLLVNGAYEGVKFWAVPSADDKVHLPESKSAAFDKHGGDMLIGKPPYDMENVPPVAAELIATVASGDPTAEFLGKSFALQYSWTGFVDDSGEDADMVHAKGMLIVCPSGYWSEEQEGLEMVCSKQDMKTLSSWREQRDRASLPTEMVSTGSLRVKEIVPPGNCGALPIAELRKRDMDCDGDLAFGYAGYPALTSAVKRTLHERELRRGEPRSYKPPKTATSAWENGQYQPGRAKEILDAQRGGALIGTASTAATRFLSQPDEIRHAMAEAMMFGTYKGIERELRDDLRELLEEADAPDDQKLQALQARALQASQQLQALQAPGAPAPMPEAQAAALLHEEIVRWQGLQAGRGAGEPARPQKVPAALGERFPNLAQAYAQARTPPQRISAILDNYPVCRLPQAKYPQGQPGLIDGEPELTMRNLFTIAVKVGTDALKSDTGTEVFSSVMERYSAVERSYPDRVRSVPHTKQTAALLRDDRFDAEQAKQTLARIPTMAAGVMQASIEELQRVGLLPKPATPTARVQAQVRPEEIAAAAQSLAHRARQMEPRITPVLEGAVNDAGASLQGQAHKLKSTGSLGQKLQQLVGLKHKPLDEAVSGVNDALRYSVVLDARTFTEGYRRIMARLDEQGHARTQVTNHFTKAREAFSAVSVTLRDTDGHPWEIQFHTPETFELKERFHDLYKQSHELGMQGASASERKDLTQPAWQAFHTLAIPPGCDEIDDWEIEPVPVPAPARAVRSVAQAPAQTPARHSPLVKQLAERAQAVEKTVTPLLQNAMQHAGGRLHGADRLDTHVFKGDKSLARKLALIQRETSLSPEQAASQVRDALRYVVVLEANSFGRAANEIVHALAANGMQQMRVNNGFVREGTTYAGLNMNLRLGDDDFEIQFHTPQSLAAKHDAHRNYEKLRSLPEPVRMADDDDDAGAQAFQREHERLSQTMRERAARVALPNGIGDFVSFDHYAAPSTAQPTHGSHASEERTRPEDSPPSSRHVAGLSAEARLLELEGIETDWLYEDGKDPLTAEQKIELRALRQQMAELPMRADPGTASR
jgi:hypothetical protein